MCRQELFAASFVTMIIMWTWNPDDSQWGEHVGESAELAFR
jgi:hypothetical protein